MSLQAYYSTFNIDSQYYVGCIFYTQNQGGKTMRNPNGFGSVVYLGKKRRKPYAARITVERTIDEVTKKSIQKYKYIGYFEERKDAIKALAKYNDNPYDIDAASITFSELYDKWSTEKYPKMKEWSYVNI